MFKSIGGWVGVEKHKLIQDRFDVIFDHVNGKTVLDCGSGGEEIKPGELWWETHFLHKKIKEIASVCIGIDNDSAAVEQLNNMGFDIRFGDIETIDMGQLFDIVMAGEFIEHLSNPGLFLETVKRHLAPGGKLILSTPNAWALGNLVRSLYGRKIVINKGHIAWYDQVMIEQLLARHGFKIEEFYWQQRVFRRATHLVKWFPHWALNFIVIASPTG